MIVFVPCRVIARISPVWLDTQPDGQSSHDAGIAVQAPKSRLPTYGSCWLSEGPRSYSFHNANTGQELRLPCVCVSDFPPTDDSSETGPLITNISSCSFAIPSIASSASQYLTFHSFEKRKEAKSPKDTATATLPRETMLSRSSASHGHQSSRGYSGSRYHSGTQYHSGTPREKLLRHRQGLWRT